MGDKILVYRFLMEKPEGKRTFGRPRLIWKDNIKKHFQQMVWEGVNWTYYVSRNKEE
jgi:hypothetical protein